MVPQQCLVRCISLLGGASLQPRHGTARPAGVDGSVTDCRVGCRNTARGASQAAQTLPPSARAATAVPRDERSGQEWSRRLCRHPRWRLHRSRGTSQAAQTLPPSARGATAVPRNRGRRCMPPSRHPRAPKASGGREEGWRSLTQRDQSGLRRTCCATPRARLRCALLTSA